MITNDFFGFPSLWEIPLNYLIPLNQITFYVKQKRNREETGQDLEAFWNHKYFIQNWCLYKNKLFWNGHLISVSNITQAITQTYLVKRKKNPIYTGPILNVRSLVLLEFSCQQSVKLYGIEPLLSKGISSIFFTYYITTWSAQSTEQKLQILQTRLLDYTEHFAQLS